MKLMVIQYYLHLRRNYNDYEDSYVEDSKEKDNIRITEVDECEEPRT